MTVLSTEMAGWTAVRDGRLTTTKRLLVVDALPDQVRAEHVEQEVELLREEGATRQHRQAEHDRAG